MNPPRYLFREIAPGRDFHAALVSLRGGRDSDQVLHRHDFWEIMYLLEGECRHWINGHPSTLTSGHMLLIRPDDCHRVRAAPGEKLNFINVAVSAPAWRDFCGAAELKAALQDWMASPDPPTTAVSARRREIYAVIFRDVLQAYLEHPTRLDLFRFLGASLPLLMTQSGNEPSESAPPAWLSRARNAMLEGENLRLGVPCLVALSGVTPAHLARSFQSHYGQTPTAFVNELRLKRATFLLRTTTREIIDVAQECGFNNLSYFYRAFSRRYGLTPRRYRLDAWSGVIV
jgi:AraC-like DNA-binding protein/mannose-6-phosphate isomerase-like protein (cupin superfamily)